MKLITTLILGLALAAAGYCAEGKGKAKGHAGKAGPAVTASVDIRWTAGDIRIVRDYFRNPSNLPPGLAKKDRLPPGLEKQLLRNGHLPPGLEKKLVAFPPDLEQRLPPLCAGCRRVVLSGKAIILRAAEQVILDLFDLWSR